jgi:hypothetical protein
MHFDDMTASDDNAQKVQQDTIATLPTAETGTATQETSDPASGDGEKDGAVGAVHSDEEPAEKISASTVMAVFVSSDSNNPVIGPFVI